MKLKGIVKYSIDLDGCLVGIFTNTTGRINDGYSEIFPEMAKKNPNDENETIVGVYRCYTFDNDPQCILQISADGNDKVFHFEWFTLEISKPFHRGIGMQIDDKTIIVSYWQP